MDTESGATVLLYVIFIKEPKLSQDSLLVLCEQIPGGSANWNYLTSRENGTPQLLFPLVFQNCQCCALLSITDKRFQGTEC